MPTGKTNRFEIYHLHQFVQFQQLKLYQKRRFECKKDSLSSLFSLLKDRPVSDEIPKSVDDESTHRMIPIFNFSNRKLTDYETKIVSKGLGFGFKDKMLNKFDFLTNFKNRESVS
jgi:hypothetical protein